MTKVKALMVVLLSLFSFHGLFPAQALQINDQPPSTQNPKGPRPSVTVRELAKHPVPALTGQGEEARKNALAFIDWASASTKAQDELVRKAVAAARDNADILQAFCDEAFTVQSSDHSRALVALALLGEARSRSARSCFMKFVNQPWPETGTVVDGEIVEQTELGQLQAKAIDGLAYLRDQETDRFILDTVANHPSRIVRAEAIAAYLWNNAYSPQSREALRSVVHKDELIFLDRPVRRAGEPKESFNRKLAAYLKDHPELKPPKPRKAEAKPKPIVGQPPKF